MAGRDLVVIGGSAGALEPLQRIVAELPADLPAAVLVVLHISPYSKSRLPEILSRVGALPVRHAEDGQMIRPGQIYVAPPNRHLIVGNGVLRVTLGPYENNTRPAIDPLFRSAAEVYGPRVAGVILSGALDDGTFGLATIKRRGGYALVQDPDEARVSSMPSNACRRVSVDQVLPAAGLGPALVEAVHAGTEVEEGGQPVQPATPNAPGSPTEHLSGYSCPACHGALWQVRVGEFKGFRCRTGHRFSQEAMTAQQALYLEDALWAALNILEERETLMMELALTAREAGRSEEEARYEARAASARERAAVIRQVLEVDEGAAE